MTHWLSRYNFRGLAEERIVTEDDLSSVLREQLQAASTRSSRIVTETNDTGRAIEAVLAHLREIVPYDSASVQELREGRLVIIGGVGFADLDVILGESFDIDSADSPNGEVVYRRRPKRVGDTEQYRGFRRGLHVGENIHSWLGVPLISGDQVLGIIALDKLEPDFYTPEHEHHAIAFAAVAAAAMARAKG